MIEIEFDVDYVGRRVRIVDDSIYYYQAYNHDGNGEGIIVGYDSPNPEYRIDNDVHYFTVKWDNEHINSYRTIDLNLIDDNKPFNANKVKWYKNGKLRSKKI